MGATATLLSPMMESSPDEQSRILLARPISNRTFRREVVAYRRRAQDASTTSDVGRGLRRRLRCATQDRAQTGASCRARWPTAIPILRPRIVACVASTLLVPAPIVTLF